MGAHVRAAGLHEAAARIHRGLGEAARARLEVDRAAAERAAFDVAVAQHPEWVGPARPAGWGLGSG